MLNHPTDIVPLPLCKPCERDPELKPNVFQLIRGASLGFFVLVDDPLAENPISHHLNPGVYEYLVDEAEVYLAQKLSAQQQELESKDLEELRSLGYIQ